MKKYIFLFFVLLWGIFNLHAQTADTLENPGFEQWEVPFGLPADHPEPVNWSSIKTSDNPDVNPMAPVNWARSDTAHSGKYSLRLFNVASLGLVATGTISNGRYHTEVSNTKSYVYTDTANSMWHTRFTARPDSLVGWFMCNPKAGDHGNVLAILHTGYAQTPLVDHDSSTWIGKASFDLPGTPVTKWTRFAVPFRYYSDKSPQYILLVLTSGNGAKAIAGSVAWFDDLNVTFSNSNLGISSHRKKGNFFAYSNQNTLYLSLKNAPYRNYNIQVINILGRTLYKNTLNNNQKISLNLSLPPGLYLVKAQKGNSIFVKKVIIR